VAAVGALAAWRRQPDHPLQWDLVAGKFIPYRAGDLKRYWPHRLNAERTRHRNAPAIA
jgi:hypothetical protein